MVKGDSQPYGKAVRGQSSIMRLPLSVQPPTFITSPSHQLIRYTISSNSTDPDPDTSNPLFAPIVPTLMLTILPGLEIPKSWRSSQSGWEFRIAMLRGRDGSHTIEKISSNA